ncbi:MAG: hypothetical protein HOO67_03625 [Candidatus Peribacteraceae bacterium]|nr:hypothetical protein [Candidatus Peribacteraceae bacterium]
MKYEASDGKCTFPALTEGMRLRNRQGFLARTLQQMKLQLLEAGATPDSDALKHLERIIRANRRLCGKISSILTIEPKKSLWDCNEPLEAQYKDIDRRLSLLEGHIGAVWGESDPDLRYKRQEIRNRY